MVGALPHGAACSNPHTGYHPEGLTERCTGDHRVQLEWIRSHDLDLDLDIDLVDLHSYQLVCIHAPGYGSPESTLFNMVRLE